MPYFIDLAQAISFQRLQFPEKLPLKRKFLLPTNISSLTPTFEDRIVVILALFLCANVDGLLVVVKVNGGFYLVLGRWVPVGEMTIDRVAL